MWKRTYNNTVGNKTIENKILPCFDPQVEQVTERDGWKEKDVGFRACFETRKKFHGSASKGQSTDFTNHLILLWKPVCVYCMCEFFSGMRWGLQDFIISQRALWPCQDHRVQFKSLYHKLSSILVGILKLSETAEKGSSLISSPNILRT